MCTKISLLYLSICIDFLRHVNYKYVIFSGTEKHLSEKKSIFAIFGRFSKRALTDKDRVSNKKTCFFVFFGVLGDPVFGPFFRC